MQVCVYLCMCYVLSSCSGNDENTVECYVIEKFIPNNHEKTYYIGSLYVRKREKEHLLEIWNGKMTEKTNEINK